MRRTSDRSWLRPPAISVAGDGGAVYQAHVLSTFADRLLFWNPQRTRSASRAVNGAGCRRALRRLGGQALVEVGGDALFEVRQVLDPEVAGALDHLVVDDDALLGAQLGDHLLDVGRRHHRVGAA